MPTLQQTEIVAHGFPGQCSVADPGCLSSRHPGDCVCPILGQNRVDRQAYFSLPGHEEHGAFLSSNPGPPIYTPISCFLACMDLFSDLYL